MSTRAEDVGYVRIYRALLGNASFRNDGEALAFAWMVIRAAWRPTRINYKDRTITLQRGQLAVSTRDMATAIDRDKAWITRFWNRAKNEAMIETRAETGVTVITICNYDQFQGERDRGETPAETQPETRVRQGRDTEQRKEEDKNTGGRAPVHVREGQGSTGLPSQPSGPDGEVIEAARFAWPLSHADRRQLQAWEADGIDRAATVIPVIRRVAEERSVASDPPSTLRYFDRSVRAAHAEDQRLREHFADIHQRYGVAAGGER
jgi:hypothetical protein